MSRIPRWKSLQAKATGALVKYREALEDKDPELAEEYMEMAEKHIEAAKKLQRPLEGFFDD